MKRVVILIIILAMSANVCMMAQHAQQVTRAEAVRAGMTWLNGSNHQSDRAIQNSRLVEKMDGAGNVVLYELVTDSFSVLLSGSKACYPLLGKYNTTNGSLLDNYDSLPNNIRWIIDGYIGQVSSCFDSDTTRLYHYDNWNSLIEGTNQSTRSAYQVGPLLTTKWMQRGCNTGNDIGYEYYCVPETQANCSHYVVECVAVALGQVLNYWKHPVSPSWEKTYDWCNMSDELDANSPTFLENREAIARLLKDCADAIPTYFGCIQSSADFNLIPYALVNQFKYKSTARIIQKTDYPQEVWVSLLKHQLDNGCPIIYNAKTIDGKVHAFVCDGYGYDLLDTFFIYCNFGAGNYDGFFKLDEIHVEDDTLIYDQKAIINIYPDNSIPLCNRNLVLDEYYNQYLDANMNPWNIPPVTVTNLTSASITSDATWRTIPSGAITTYQAQESVTLKDGFSVEMGADFAAIISPCDNCGHCVLEEEQNAYLSPSTSGDMEGMGDLFSRQEESAPYLENRAVEEMETKEGFTLMPNPANGYVNVKVHVADLDTRNTIIALHDDRGNEFLRRVLHKGETLLTLSLDGLSSGFYFVTLTTSKGSTTQKLVVE